jgi:fructose-6-phosphate aldolase 2
VFKKDFRGGNKMLYLLDTADVEAIEEIVDCYPIAGVTTNPTIIAKRGKNVIDTIKEIRNVIGDESMLHVQTLGETAEEMVREANILRDAVKGNFYAKIPVNEQGLKTMKSLKKDGFNITATAIFTQQQALIAIMAGADFVAPYVNRLDNISSSGIKVVEDIVQLIKTYGLNTKVLAASFKNVEQVHQVSLSGAHSVTINPDICGNLIYHPLTQESIIDFILDGYTYYNL